MLKNGEVFALFQAKLEKNNNSEDLGLEKLVAEYPRHAHLFIEYKCLTINKLLVELELMNHAIDYTHNISPHDRNK